MIRMDSHIYRSSKTAWQIVGEKTLIVTPATSTLHALNRTGSRIWEILEKRAKMEDIVGKICTEFEVEEEMAKKGIFEFIKELSDKGVVIVENSEGSRNL